MALRTLVRRNKNGKIPVTRQRHNLHSFIKQGVNFLGQSTLKTRRIYIYLAQLSLQSPLLLSEQTITKKLSLAENFNSFLHRFEFTK